MLNVPVVTSNVVVFFACFLSNRRCCCFFFFFQKIGAYQEFGLRDNAPSEFKLPRR